MHADIPGGLREHSLDNARGRRFKLLAVERRLVEPADCAWRENDDIRIGDRSQPVSLFAELGLDQVRSGWQAAAGRGVAGCLSIANNISVATRREPRNQVLDDQPCGPVSTILSAANQISGRLKHDHGRWRIDHHITHQETRRVDDAGARPCDPRRLMSEAIWSGVWPRAGRPS